VVTHESEEKATGTATCSKTSLVATVLLAATPISRQIAPAVRTHGCRPLAPRLDPCVAARLGEAQAAEAQAAEASAPPSAP